jgi:hypothetical protein
MPSLMSGAALAPALGGDADQFADAVLVERDERVDSRMPLGRVGRPRNEAASSREMPKVVCVRSLVPKEKNSALSAISPARSAARGSSIMVPT